MTMDQQPQSPQPAGGPETLDRLLAWHAHKTPAKLALVDPANRDIVQNPMAAANERAYDFASLESAVARLAARFRATGLLPGDYVAVQLPNLSESYIVTLALMRARLVPCLMPLTFASEQLGRALQRLKPLAIVGCGRLDGVDHSHTLRDAASSEISIRFLFGVGHWLVDGFEDLGPLIESDDTVAEHTDLPAPGVNDLALVTFVDPVTCVPHTHGQLLAAGLLHVKELALSAGDQLLSAYAPSSLVGLTALACPWLITGSTLTLHHPLDKALLQQQLAARHTSFFAGPEPLIAWFARGNRPKPGKIGVVWRHGHMPARRLAAPAEGALFDLWNLADIGIVPARRSGAEASGLFPGGRICLPGDGSRDMCLAAGEVLDGSLLIRGRIFPNPSQIGNGLEWFGFRRLLKGDSIDTGIAAFEAPGDTIFIGDDTLEAAGAAAE